MFTLSTEKQLLTLNFGNRLRSAGGGLKLLLLSRCDQAYMSLLLMWSLDDESRTSVTYTDTRLQDASPPPLFPLFEPPRPFEKRRRGFGDFLMSVTQQGSPSGNQWHVDDFKLVNTGRPTGSSRPVRQWPRTRVGVFHEASINQFDYKGDYKESVYSWTERKQSYFLNKISASLLAPRAHFLLKACSYTILKCYNKALLW